MDPESSRFSTADYSFHQNPPDNNEYIFNNNSPNCGYYPLTIPFWWQDHFTIEIDFDQGVPLPFSEMPTSYAHLVHGADHH
jgi:hypothetical protein